MEEYRRRQQQRWSGEPLEGRTVTPPSEVLHHHQSETNRLVKLHILPIDQNLSEARREEEAFSFVSARAQKQEIVHQGAQFFDEHHKVKFAVVATEPAQGGIPDDRTEIFVNGPFVAKLDRLQLIALCAPGEEPSEEISDRLFRQVVGPYMREHVTDSQTVVVSMGHALRIGNDRFVPIAMDPAPEDGLAVVSLETVVYIDADQSGEFERIHVLPFQDTLPRVYDFDVFSDYLEPYFTMNPLALFSVNTQFAFHGVQFKVVCVDPSDGRPRRVGPNTIIHSEGLLHATLRNMLPAELLAQLSTLPPGLQMLLLNTELLASADVLDRFIDLQETLAARRGIPPETLEALPVETYKKPEPGTENSRPESATQCMICLSEFEEGESLRRLPCTHVFHQTCIDEWLLHRSTSCCLCKVDVATDRQSE